jgi:hypothetical protein
MIVVSSTLCRKHEAVATAWTSLSVTPSMLRRASIRALVPVKPSSSEWVIISLSSHFILLPPNFLEENLHHTYFFSTFVPKLIQSSNERDLTDYQR